MPVFPRPAAPAYFSLSSPHRKSFRWTLTAEKAMSTGWSVGLMEDQTSLRYEVILADRVMRLCFSLSLCLFGMLVNRG